MLAIAWVARVAPVANAESAYVSAHACPFCAAINATFAQQIEKHQITVIAKLIELPPKVDEDSFEFPKGQFEIVQVIKGGEFVSPGMKFRTQLVGVYKLDEQFLIMGVEPPDVLWSTPMKTSDRINEYLLNSQKLPPAGGKRLTFFQDYFEDEESILAFDAYDEFAIAPYEDVLAMKDQIKREKLVEWIRDPEIRIDRRRLYFTMLGVCGTEKEIEMLEEFIRSGDPQQQAGLDALVSAYLTLKGESGVSLIEDTFLKGQDLESKFVETNAVISALRFHGTEVEIIPRKRISQAVRLVLKYPNCADIVIPDLARWEDWSVMDRLVEIFKTCGDDSYVRVPIANYLQVCPLPEAKEHLKELEKIDPEAVRRATFFLGGFMGDGLPDDDDDESDNESKEKSSDEAESTDSAMSPADGEMDPQSVRSANRGQYVSSSIFKDPLTFVATGTAFLTSAGSDGSDGLAQAWGDEPKEENSDSANSASDSQNPPEPDTSELFGGGIVLKIPHEIPLEPGKTEVRSFISNRAGSSIVPIDTASIQESAPVAMVTGNDVTWLIIFVPIAFSLAIFILIWSVVNGWFERLIY